MFFMSWESSRRTGLGPAPRRLRGLTLCEDRVADGRRGRRLRRPKCVHILPLRLFLGGAVAQADLVLVRIDPDDFEIVFLTGGEQRRRSLLAGQVLALALRPPLLDLG